VVQLQAKKSRIIELLFIIILNKYEIKFVDFGKANKEFIHNSPSSFVPSEFKNFVKALKGINLSLLFHSLSTN
jgi:hypothetical protein